MDDDRRVGVGFGRAAYALAVAAYLIGLLLWLSIGIIPSLARHLPALEQALLSWAAGGGPLSEYARRVIESAPMSAPVVDLAVAYLFSLLNLALGILLLVKRRRHLVPGLLALAVLGTAATFNEPSHGVFHVLGEPPLVTGIHFVFHVVSGVAYLWAVILFPDGSSPVGRAISRDTQRLVAVLITVALAVFCWASSFISHPPFFVAFFGVIVPVVGMAAQTAHLRHANGRAAAQSRVLRVALLPALVAAVLWSSAEGLAVAGLARPASDQLAAGVQSAFPAVFAVVPVMMFVAIVRYRLWDIDLIARRMVVLGLLLGLVGLVYVGSLAVTGWWWRDRGIAGLLPLIVVACVVEPFLGWGRRLANRLVFGARMSPREAVRAMVDRSGAGETDELAELTRVVVDSTRASTSSVHLRRELELLRLSQYPADPEAEPRIRISAPQLSACAAALAPARCFPVTYESTLLGILAVSTPKGVALSRTEVRLLEQLGQHAGLLVANTLLTVDLARQVEIVDARIQELDASRRQVVRAQDEQRRRLESDIHDGAQQQLVAVILQLGVLDRFARSQGIAPSPGQVTQVQQLVKAAQETVTTLAAGGAPARLAADGLQPALQEITDGLRRIGLAADLDCTDDLSEIGPEIGVAVYFCCQEAVQNTVKHARASSIRIEIRSDADHLEFRVIDDGAGFAPQARPNGSGFGNLRLRLAALGGRIEVESVPGTGTTVRGRIPQTRRQLGTERVDPPLAVVR